METKVYIVGNYDNDYSRAVRLTEAQAKAINWFIDNILDSGADYYCELPEDTACDIC